MEMSMNSPTLDFVHKPNELIAFLHNQCKLHSSNYLVPISEQHFIEMVENGDDIIVERHGYRKSGGTTLLTFIGLYYLLKGRPVTYMFTNNYVGLQTKLIDDIGIIGYDIKVKQDLSGVTSVYLSMGKNRTPYGMVITNHMNNIKYYMHKNKSSGVLLVDGICHNDYEYNKTLARNELLPIVSANNGRLIMNISD